MELLTEKYGNDMKYPPVEQLLGIHGGCVLLKKMTVYAKDNKSRRT